MQARPVSAPLPLVGLKRRLARVLQPRLLAVAAATAALSSFAQVLDCETIPESRQGLCRELVACLTIDGDNRRDRCIDAAQRRPAPSPEPTPVQEPARATPPPGSEAALPKLITVTPAAPAPAPEPATEPPVIRAPAQRAPPPSPRQVENRAANPPDRFTAEVSAIRESILDRRIVALDQRYVFESARAGEARLNVGDRVEVTKAGGLVGRKWRIVGPNKRPFTATRIRCERDELGSANLRKCALLNR